MTEIWQLFGGLFIALIFASSVGYILKRRSGVDTPNSVIDNLNARINAWWVMIGIIFIASLLGFYGVIGLFLIISFMGLRVSFSIEYSSRRSSCASRLFLCDLAIAIFFSRH